MCHVSAAAKSWLYVHAGQRHAFWCSLTPRSPRSPVTRVQVTVAHVFGLRQLRGGAGSDPTTPQNALQVFNVTVKHIPRRHVAPIAHTPPLPTAPHGARAVLIGRVNSVARTPERTAPPQVASEIDVFFYDKWAGVMADLRKNVRKHASVQAAATKRASQVASLVVWFGHQDLLTITGPGAKVIRNPK